MMRRRAFAVAVAGAFCLTPRVARAQGASRVYHLGILRPGMPAAGADAAAADVFAAPLRDLG